MRSAHIAVVAAAVPTLAFAQSTDDSTDAPLTAGYTQPAWSDFESTVSVSDFLTGLYGSGAVPAAATGAAATSLASALYSHEQDLMSDQAYLEAANDVYNIYATQSDSGEAALSSFGEGFLKGEWTSAGWWVSAVPTSAQSEFISVLDGYRAVETSVLGGADATGTAATAKATATGSVTATSSGATTGSATGNSASAKSTSSSTAGAPRSMVTGGAVVGLAAMAAAAMC